MRKTILGLSAIALMGFSAPEGLNQAMDQVKTYYQKVVEFASDFKYRIFVKPLEQAKSVTNAANQRSQEFASSVNSFAQTGGQPPAPQQK